MIVKVDLPPKMVWAISKKAESRGVSFSEMLVAVMLDVGSKAPAEPEETPPPTVVVEKETTIHRRLRQLWRLSFSDADIAAEMGVTPGAVGRLRREMHLPANRRSVHTREAARRAAEANLTERIKP